VAIVFLAAMSSPNETVEQTWRGRTQRTIRAFRPRLCNKLHQRLRVTLGSITAIVTPLSAI